MKIVVISNSNQVEELTAQGLVEGTEMVRVSGVEELKRHQDAEAFIDLLFDGSPARVNALQELLPATVIINAVSDTLQETDPLFIRINGWKSFLRSPLVEASAALEQQSKAEKVFNCFNKSLQWLPDHPGFVSARIVSMIINEAIISHQEGVSTKEEIDTAMKLGTNYPYGPFEWADLIGKENIDRLLRKLVKD